MILASFIEGTAVLASFRSHAWPTPEALNCEAQALARTSPSPSYKAHIYYNIVADNPLDAEAHVILCHLYVEIRDAHVARRNPRVNC